MTTKFIRITMSGPAEVVDASLDAFVRQYGWTDEVLGEPNPQSKEDRAREVLFAFILDTVKFYNRRMAEEAAAQVAQAAVDALVPLTSLELVVDEEPPPPDPGE